MMINRLFPLLGIGASILLYILTLATTNTSWLAQYYWWVIAIAAILIIILLIKPTGLMGKNETEKV